ncbi:acyl-CoA synthetase [Mycobacterium leprae Kyoto-2]|uniref:Acyl-CoA synthase n=4 Tax=Mycobacterium leprae TaxID=1769 RepID=Q9CCY8_MYCLE|nr:FadD7 family fatty acid--CoA ligase [Mycobacterium leprae]CAR72761.1 acyl-CoA synthase [Mycobacterium leprae Br4923]AWV48859.1 acyl-CoA synthetase [Mycobacterium leprae]OAR21233.1 acyl-CoA synthetase [Mycobacterium leprae 3125609]OAX71377.1 acyl-CoA synthetase [Mycobacterium leprae 7935681]CAC32193.1 acyl-CoA synthase [Mycobacterium leprae]
MKSESITSSRAPVEQIDARLTGQFESPSIASLVEAAAIRNPSAPALVVTDNRIVVSYRDLLRLVDDLTVQLALGGLLPGDRVALCAASNIEFVVGLLAASRAGLIVVPLDPALPVNEQCIRSQAAGVRVTLVDSLALEGVSDQRAATMRYWPIAVSYGSVTGASEGSLLVHLDDTAALHPVTSTPDGLRHDDAMIMFTGGTTGLPKMVPWTDGNIAGSVHAIITAYQLGPQDATVVVMPLYHGHGLIAALLSTLASGGVVLLPARARFSARTFWDDIDAVAATWYTAAPAIHRILLELASTQSFRSKRAKLRFIRSCSAPLTQETAQALREEFLAPVICAFGMTEATHQVTTTNIKWFGQGENPTVTNGLVGQSTGVQIRIVGSDGQPLPPDTVGEVWLRGSTVVRGYLGDPAITAANFTHGWLRTGDLGSLSVTGDLRIRGRIKELINRSGEKISPERVEGVLASHHNVMEVAVFGDPDKVYGETVTAVIVPREVIAPTPSELAVFCRDRLAAFEVPTRFQEASALPHTAKGSLDRRAVAEQFAHRG